MNDEQGRPALAWTLGVLKGLLTGEDVDSRDRGYGRALIDAIERLCGDAGPRQASAGSGEAVRRSPKGH